MRTTRTSGGLGPDEHGHEHESFARAVDGGLRGFSASELDRDLAVVAALRQAGTMVKPAPQERDRMRQRLMAEFSSVVHEGNSPVLELRPTRRRRHRASVPEDPRSRFMVAAAAALCLVMSLSGMSLLLSRDAVPGDALYNVKRSAETAELGLTFGDERKGLKHLEFAESRVSEIEALAQQANAVGTWSGEDRFLRTLRDFELDTTAGTRLITTLAAEGQTAMLPSLRDWVQQQQQRLRAVQGALPLATSTRLDSTLELLDRISTRATALDQRSICDTITSEAEDDLGPLPATGSCSADQPDGLTSAAPLPEDLGTPGPGSESGLLPPSLFAAPPSEESAAEDQDGEEAERFRLLPAPSDDGVLPRPDESDSDPTPERENRPGPLRQILPEPSDGQGIPLLPLLTPEDDRVG